MRPDNRDIIDVYPCISNNLLLLINSISDLKDEACRVLHRTNKRSRTSEQQTEAARPLITRFKQLKQSLLGLQQHVPAAILASDPKLAVVLQQMAEYNRMAAIILLYETFEVTFPQRTSVVLSLLDGASFRKTDAQVYVKEVLHLIREVLTYAPQSPPPRPVWALFIAGCCAESEVDRIAILELVEVAIEKLKMSVRAKSIFSSLTPDHSQNP